MLSGSVTDASLPHDSLTDAHSLFAGISATPHKENPRHFDVVISGPKGCCYEGGTFKLEMFLPEEYPMCPPKVRIAEVCFLAHFELVACRCIS